MRRISYGKCNVGFYYWRLLCYLKDANGNLLLCSRYAHTNMQRHFLRLARRHARHWRRQHHLTRRFGTARTLSCFPATDSELTQKVLSGRGGDANYGQRLQPSTDIVRRRAGFGWRTGVYSSARVTRLRHHLDVAARTTPRDAPTVTLARLCGPCGRWLLLPGQHDFSGPAAGVMRCYVPGDLAQVAPQFHKRPIGNHHAKLPEYYIGVFGIFYAFPTKRNHLSFSGTHKYKAAHERKRATASARSNRFVTTMPIKRNEYDRETAPAARQSKG